MTPFENEILSRKNKTKLERQIEHWLDTVNYKEFNSEIASRVIGQPELNLVTANVYNYLSNIVDNDYKQTTCDSNMILAAPSGSGKTETFRALKEYFSTYIPALPIYKYDLSQITSAGFKGNDAIDILAPFYDLGFMNAIGLVFLDEFDKKLKPSFAGGGMDVNEDAQCNLLTMIEGSTVCNKNGQMVDTSRLMFVGLGSFDSYRKMREDKPRVIGYEANNDSSEVSHYEPLTKEDIVKHGGTNELVGRFKYVINYGELTDEAVDKIVAEVVKKSSISFNCDVILSDKIQEQLREDARSKFGCRGIASTIDSLLLREYSLSLLEENEENHDVLVVTLVDKTTSTHVWRPFTEEEIDEMSSYMTIDRNDSEKSCPDLTDDEWKTLDQIQKDYDPFE